MCKLKFKPESFDMNQCLRIVKKEISKAHKSSCLYNLHICCKCSYISSKCFSCYIYFCFPCKSFPFSCLYKKDLVVVWLVFQLGCLHWDLDEHILHLPTCTGH